MILRNKIQSPYKIKFICKPRYLINKGYEQLPVHFENNKYDLEFVRVLNTGFSFFPRFHIKKDLYGFWTIHLDKQEQHGQHIPGSIDNNSKVVLEEVERIFPKKWRKYDQDLYDKYGNKK